MPLHSLLDNPAAHFSISSLPPPSGLALQSLVRRFSPRPL